MTTLETALCLHKQGFSCIPIVPGDKTPAISSWKLYQSALPKTESLEKWFSNPALNIALICGEVTCLDFDAVELLPDFVCRAEQAGLGDLVDRLILQQTQNGGNHLIFRCEGEQLPNMKLASTKDNSVLIETRSFGGYFLISPSAGYDMIRGKFDAIPEITEEEREDLIIIAKTFNEHFKEAKPAKEPRRDTVEGKLSPGDDFDHRGDVRQLLIAHGWTPVGDVHWRRPGKDKGISASFNHIENRFWVWSTSTAFETETLYRPWHVFAMLEHGGDYSAAASSLRKQGYGAKPSGVEQYQPEAVLQPLPKSEQVELPELPSPLKDIVDEAVRLYGVDSDLPTLQALGAASAAMRKIFELSVPPYISRGNIFALIAAISGSGKSLVYRLITSPLFERQKVMIKRWMENESADLQAEAELLAVEKKVLMKPSKSGSKEEQKRALTEVNKRLAEVESRMQAPRLIVEDVTTQQLAVLMQANNECLALLSSEAGDVISNLFGRNNSTDKRTDEHLDPRQNKSYRFKVTCGRRV